MIVLKLSRYYYFFDFAAESAVLASRDTTFVAVERPTILPKIEKLNRINEIIKKIIHVVLSTAMIIKYITEKNYNTILIMSSTIAILTFMFSFINILYMNTMQHSLYEEFISEPKIMVLFLAYFAWCLMAFATKRFIIDDKSFNFVSLFTTAPLLGLTIYMCINVAIMCIVPEWSTTLAITDVMFGTIMFSFVSLIALLFKPYFN